MKKTERNMKSPENELLIYLSSAITAAKNSTLFGPSRQELFKLSQAERALQLLNVLQREIHLAVNRGEPSNRSKAAQGTSR